MSKQLHAAAVLARLGAAPGATALVVHDGKVPDVPEEGSEPPYALVYFMFRALRAAESPGTTSLTFASTTQQVDAWVHCVGDNAEAARKVAQRVEGQLLNWRPTVTGRTCGPVKQIDSQPARRDETTGELRVDQVDVYRFVSVPS